MKNFVEPFEIFSQKEISLYFFHLSLLFWGKATRNLKNMLNAKQRFPIFV